MTRVSLRGLLLGIPTLAAAGGAGVVFTYYVDSVNGNDANDGSSEALAFATLGAVPELTTGQSVGLARGSVFRGDKLATISANNVTIAAYGDAETAKPVLRGDAVLSAGGWTKTEGLTNVYERAITFDADVSGVILVFEDDAFMTRQTSTALVDANPGTYYTTGDTSGSGTLYIHTSDSADPAANSKVYEFTDTKLIINSFDATGTVLRDLVCMRSIYQNGPVYLGRSSRIYNCDFLQGSRHNFIARTGLLAEDCLFADGYNPYVGGASLFVVYEADSQPTDSFTVRRCTASNSNSSYSITGFLSHEQGGGNRFGTITYEDCAAIDCNVGWSLIDADNFVLTGCSATDCTYGITGNSTNSEAVITGFTATGVDYGVNFSGTGTTLNLIDADITQNVAAGGGCVYGNNGGTINVIGGVFKADLPTSLSARTCFGLNAIDTTWNVSGARMEVRRPIDFLTDNHTLATMDNNSYSTAALLWRYKGTSSSGLATWQSASNFDLNSTQDT